MSTPSEVQRAYIEPFSGAQFIPLIEEVGRAYEAGGVDEVKRIYPEVVDLIDPRVEWQAEPVGTFFGRGGLLSFWRDWAVLWETYVYDVREFEDHGSCALTVTHVEAKGRDGIEVDMFTFQVWEVRDGKIVWQKTCFTREEALEAAAERCA